MNLIKQVRALGDLVSVASILAESNETPANVRIALKNYLIGFDIPAIEAALTGVPRYEWSPLSDEDRQRIFESLPNMLEGFLKTWGWLQFAKAIEQARKEKNEALLSKAASPECLSPTGWRLIPISPTNEMRDAARKAFDRELQKLANSVDDKYEELRNDAYLERNQVVAALAKCFPSGIARTAIDGWSEDWHGCVYIDLPTGQASWHYHDSHAHLFAWMQPYAGKWDGHTTEEKYRRLAALRAHKDAVPDGEKQEPYLELEGAKPELMGNRGIKVLRHLRDLPDGTKFYACLPARTNRRR